MPFLDDQELVELAGSIELLLGDSLKIKYTLNWRYRGGDDGMVVLPAPAPGFEIEFVSVAA